MEQKNLAESVDREDIYFNFCKYNIKYVLYVHLGKCKRGSKKEPQKDAVDRLGVVKTTSLPNR